MDKREVGIIIPSQLCVLRVPVEDSIYVQKKVCVCVCERERDQDTMV
jgi:hypothetical protein